MQLLRSSPQGRFIVHFYTKVYIGAYRVKAKCHTWVWPRRYTGWPPEKKFNCFHLMVTDLTWTKVIFTRYYIPGHRVKALCVTWVWSDHDIAQLKPFMTWYHSDWSNNWSLTLQTYNVILLIIFRPNVLLLSTLLHGLKSLTISYTMHMFHTFIIIFIIYCNNSLNLGRDIWLLKKIELAELARDTVLWVRNICDESQHYSF